VNDPRVEPLTDRQRAPDAPPCRPSAAVESERPETTPIECDGAGDPDAGGDHRRVANSADLGGESPCLAHLLDDPLA
jgi:hypothetical protein